MMLEHKQEHTAEAVLCEKTPGGEQTVSIRQPGVVSIAVPAVDTTRAILQRAARQVRQGKQQKNALTVIMACGLPFAIVGLFAVIGGLYTLVTGRLPEGVTEIGLGMLPVLFVWALNRAIYRVKRKAFSAAAQDMATLNSVQAVGPLAEALWLEERATQGMAADALTRLLPQLRASDMGLLNAYQRQCLHRVLAAHNPGPRFTLLSEAVLKAFEQVGDATALTVVQRLAEGRTRTANQKRIQAAAKECLPFLQQRLKLQRSADTLLRASQPSSAGQDVLLRPATGSETQAPGELLRASTREEQV